MFPIIKHEKDELSSHTEALRASYSAALVGCFVSLHFASGLCEQRPGRYKRLQQKLLQHSCDVSRRRSRSEVGKMAFICTEAAVCTTRAAHMIAGEAMLPRKGREHDRVVRQGRPDISVVGKGRPTWAQGACARNFFQPAQLVETTEGTNETTKRCT